MKNIMCYDNKNLISKTSLLLIIIILMPLLTVSCQSDRAELSIDLLGTLHVFRLDSKDRLKSRVEISSLDGEVTLTIEKGTRFVDSDGNSIYSIHCSIELNSPWPPEGTQIMGTVYSFSPEGVTCDPPFELTMRYNPQELPSKLNEEEIAITSYKLFVCNCGATYSFYRTADNQVNPENHKVSAQISTLDNYVVLAAQEGMVVPP